MNLSGVLAGDIVAADVRGRRFHAIVNTTPDAGGLDVTPIEAWSNYHHLDARQVVEHWPKRRPRKRKASA